MRILYFAWLKAKTGIGEETVDAPGVETVSDLVTVLRQRGAGHAEALANLSAIRVAVNQDFAEFDHRLSPGDEVAFFPPVTGG
jgi:molybdopterin synthase sulfur carrier subunit